jgi:cell division cycle 2-like protein
MQQLISGVAFMHDHYIFHRDLKTSNLLLTDDGHLKICDFGMARKFGSPIKKYTSLVVTLWYRAPEILLQEKPLYTQAVDVWSVGCILAEFFLNTPLFQAQEETAQIEKILEFLGTPSKEEWPEFHNFTSTTKLRKKYRAGFRNKLPIAGSAMANQNKIVLDDMGLELLLQLLQWDPKKRITAKDALDHAWFKQKPLPVNRELLPTFPSLNKEVRQKALRKARKEAEMLKQELAGGFHM